MLLVRQLFFFFLLLVRQHPTCLTTATIINVGVRFPLLCALSVPSRSSWSRARLTLPHTRANYCVFPVRFRLPPLRIRCGLVLCWIGYTVYMHKRTWFRLLLSQTMKRMPGMSRGSEKSSRSGRRSDGSTETDGYSSKSVTTTNGVRCEALFILPFFVFHELDVSSGERGGGFGGST